jgi:CHAT domain-containing protein
VSLLILLLLCGAAAAPFSTEKAYRDARAAMDLDDKGAALAKVRAALVRAGNTEDEWVWALRVLEAYILIRNEKGDRALMPELPAKYRNSEAAVWRLLGLAVADSYANDLKAGHARLEEARKLAEAKHPRLLFPVYVSLVNVDPPNWESHLRKALELARREGNWIRIAVVRAAMARNYTGEQRYADAIDAGREALATFQAIGARGRTASAAGNLGWTYENIGDWEAAAELYALAEDNAARAGSTTRVIWENQLGNIYAVQGRAAEAEKIFQQALEHSRGLTGTQRPWILANLARLALDTGNMAKARQYVSDALQGPINWDQELYARTIDARVATVTGDYARAQKTLLDVIAKADQPEMKWLAQGYLAQLYARMQRNADADAAYRAAMDTAREARKSVKGRQELALSFFNNAAEIFNSYIAFLVRNKRDEDALAATETIRGQTLEEGLAMPAKTRKLALSAVAKQQNATILSYWLDRDRSHLWVVTPAGVVYHALPPDSTIQREVTAYRRDLAGRNGSLQRSGVRGQELYRMLVEPAGIAKGSRVIIVADDVLHALNFETLVVPAPKPHYWIEDAIVSSASSLQLLAQAAPKKSGGATMLLVGDPPVADAAFPRLAFAAQELQSVGRHFSQRVVLSRANATPASYRAATPGRFDFVHFVAHGVSSRQRPLDSAVILGRDPSKQYKLYARDIVAQPPLDARLVTISSCYGAGERTFAGEGLVGLAWAFLRAGANQVIAALWEVNDSATPKLMDLMYGGIRAGRDPAVALRDAKLALVKGKGAYQMPRYWAPFVLYSGN